MFIVIALTVLGICTLALAVALTDMLAYPHLTVGLMPVAGALLVLVAGGPKTFKQPAWLVLPIVFVWWGGTCGWMWGRHLGAIFCCTGFATIGIGLGLFVERRRRARQSSDADSGLPEATGAVGHLGALAQHSDGTDAVALSEGDGRE